MADADGKMRIEKCGWKKKMRIAEKEEKKEKCGWQNNNNNNKMNKQTNN